jgi:hypothetical protein
MKHWREKMSHIDEGVLHAYLDGESELIGSDGRSQDRQSVERHLADCAECRARLERESVLRERAAAILGGSGPAAVEPPAFREIVARSKAQQTQRRVFQLNRMKALGWAAVVVLAVGVGWIAREAVGPGPSQPEAVGRGSPQPEVVGGLETADRPQPTLTEQVGADDVERSDVDALEAAPGEAAGAPAAQRPETETLRQERARGAPPVSKSEVEPTPAEPKAGEGVVRMAEAEEQVDAPAMRGVPPEDAPAEMDVGGVAAQEREAGDSVHVADSMRMADERFAAEGRRDQVARRMVAAVPWLTGLGNESEWTPVGREEAERHLGGSLLLIPDVPVTVTRIGEFEGAPAAHSVLELPEGLVGLLQFRPTAQAADAQADAEANRENAAAALSARIKGYHADWPAVRSVTEERGVWSLTVFGQLPADSLHALLQRIPD